ncbi:MAG TPA: DUF1489 domain-containing protein [Sphingomonas sp.]|jgi:hypothetical protein|uniref:DUF1489 family protein n=1 Tax=Sphingomonas sp. TaxID=28214 RepID=UPI002ED80E08
MPLHLTKVAFGVTSVDQLAARWQARAQSGEAYLTTRYLPKRHEEVTGTGSLYWIVKHQLVARSAILRFGEAEGGRVAIHLDPEVILIHARPKRAHQGWRYLEHTDAPADLAGDETGIAMLPPALVGKLSGLALL